VLYVVARIYRFAFAKVQSQQASRRIAIKGVLYAACVVSVQTPYLLTLLLSFIFGKEAKGTIVMLVLAFTALAGFLNMIIFLLYR